MLQDNILDYSKVATKDYTTTREASDGGQLFIGTRDETVSGQISRASVVKSTNYVDQVAATCADECSINGKLSHTVQFKITAPAVESYAYDEDVTELNIRELVALYGYLANVTITAAEIDAIVADADAPIRAIIGRQS